MAGGAVTGSLLTLGARATGVPGGHLPVYDTVQVWIGSGVLLVLVMLILVEAGSVALRGHGLHPGSWFRYHRRR